MQSDQALEDSRNFEQRTTAHGIRVFFETILPVTIAAIFGKGKSVQHFLNFAVANYAPQTYAACVLAGNHHFEAAGFDVKEEKLLNRWPHSARANFLNTPDSMIGIDNLIANVEIQVRNTHDKD